MGVLTILDEELDAMKTAASATARVEGTAYFRRVASNQIILRRIPDRGNMPAQSAAARLIEDFRPEIIMVVGIAGGIDGRDGIELGDVVVPSYLHYAEYLKLTTVGELQRYFAYDQPTVCLRETFVDMARDCNDWHGANSVERPTMG